MYLAEPLSRRIAVNVATHGVYKRTNTIKANADAGEINEVKTALRGTAAEAYKTPNVEITASLAIKPVISATAICQKPKPIGEKIGAINLPILLKMLASVPTIWKDILTLLSNQTTTEAKRMIVPAREIKSHTRTHTDVSYTHLDVYKRQGSTNHSCKRDFIRAVN